MGMVYGGETYIFSKNLQGDVIGIYNSGRQLVAKYQYNAYGEITAITDASGNDVSGDASHIANVNPFRYRGYYYDTETGFYYLQSRCYDPVVGRFLNADVYVSTGQGILGNNMFAYCGNNPVNFLDFQGTDAVAVADWLKQTADDVKQGLGATQAGQVVATALTIAAFVCVGVGVVDGWIESYQQRSRVREEQERKARERTYQETKVKNKMRETQEDSCLIIGIKDGYLHYLGGPYPINYVREEIALDVLAGTNTLIPKNYTYWGFYTLKKSNAQRLASCFYPFFGCSIIDDPKWQSHSMLPHLHTDPHEININGQMHDIHFWYNQ